MNALLAETSAQLHDLVESHSRGNTPRASSSATDGTREGAVFGAAKTGQAAAAEPDLDRDLEAYLQTMAPDKEEEGSRKDEAAGSDSGSAADLDEYLNELNSGSEQEGSEEEDAVDVEKYIKSEAEHS